MPPGTPCAPGKQSGNVRTPSHRLWNEQPTSTKCQLKYLWLINQWESLTSLASNVFVKITFGWLSYTVPLSLLTTVPSLWPPANQIKAKQWLCIKQADDWLAHTVLCVKRQHLKFRKIFLLFICCQHGYEPNVSRNLHSQVAAQRNFESTEKIRLKTTNISVIKKILIYSHSPWFGA